MCQSASVLNDDEFYNKNGFVTPSNREVTTPRAVQHVVQKHSKKHLKVGLNQYIFNHMPMMNLNTNKSNVSIGICIEC